MYIREADELRTSTDRFLTSETFSLWIGQKAFITFIDVDSES